MWIITSLNGNNVAYYNIVKRNIIIENLIYNLIGIKIILSAFKENTLK